MNPRGEDEPVYGFCWLNPYSWKACDGQLRKVHLIPRRVILRELPAEVSAGAVWDPRVWVWACGGPMGNGGHHGELDQSRTLKVPRADLPPELEEFAAEHGLGWFLDREYGPKEQAA